MTFIIIGVFHSLCNNTAYSFVHFSSFCMQSRCLGLCHDCWCWMNGFFLSSLPAERRTVDCAMSHEPYTLIAYGYSVFLIWSNSLAMWRG